MKKTLVFHWPGGAWPPTMDDENLIVIDGSSPGAACSVSNAIDFDTVFIASSKAQKPSWMPYSIRTSDVQGDETLSYLGLPQKSSQSPEAKELMAFKKLNVENEDANIDNALSEPVISIGKNTYRFTVNVRFELK